MIVRTVLLKMAVMLTFESFARMLLSFFRQNVNKSMSLSTYPNKAGLQTIRTGVQLQDKTVVL